MPALCIEDYAVEPSTPISCVTTGPIFRRMKVLKKFKRRMGLGGRNASTTSLPPLTFHPVCGDNVKISSDGKIARRTESFCKGITFSSRPIKVGERIYLRLLQISTSWSGVVRFGFTSQDPSSLRELPKYACPDLTNRPGYWAKALSERYADEGLVLFYYILSTGDVHFGINGQERGVFFSGVDTRTPLWALLDVYGNSTAVELFDPMSQLNNRVRIVIDLGPGGSPTDATVVTQTNQPFAHIQSSTQFNVSPNRYSVHDVENLQPSLAQLALSPKSPDTLPLRYHINTVFTPLPFHRVRGKNIIFNNDRSVACRIETEYSHGYVFSSRPLLPGECLVVQVLATESMYVGALAFGLTSTNPAGLDSTDLPEDCDQLLDRPEYWVVSKDVAASPKAGDELAFSLSHQGQVTFSRNGSTPQVFMHVDNTLQLWAFFDIYGNTTKARILGVTSDTNHQNSQVSRSHRPEPIGRAAPYCAPENRNLPNQSSPPASQRINGVCSYNTVPSPTLERVNRQNTLSSVYSGAYMEPVSNTSTLSSVDPGPMNIQHECTVCYEKSVDAVLYMCGHMCMCYECALQQWKGRGGGQCPICRAYIKDVIRTYRS